MNEPTRETIKRLKSDIIPFTETISHVKLTSYQKQALLSLCDGKSTQYPYKQGKRTIEKFYHEFIDHVSKGVKC